MMNMESEFSRLKDVHYLDHAGAGIYSDTQINLITEYLKNHLLGNPHSLNLSSKYCYDVVDQTRNRILEHFCTNENEYSVVFNSGTTSGLKSVVEWFDWEQNQSGQFDGHFVYLRDSHTSVLGLREIAARKKVQIHCLNHDDAFYEFQKSISNSSNQKNGVGLLVYPAMCNFSGCKYPLEWIEKLHINGLDHFVDPNGCNSRRRQWFCLLDAASFVPTNKLDLSRYKPDFVVFSFYKIFGYPTGLGALLIKNSSQQILKKKYYGGGTVLMSLSDARNFVKRPILHEWLEDGTVNYLSIASLKHGFEVMKRIGGDMDQISERVFKITSYLHHELLNMHHSNNSPVVKIYHDTDYSDRITQGGIINFNLLRCTGEYVGYIEVLHVANSYGIHLRIGCFCNPGACQRHLNLSNEEILRNYQKGHTCVDNIDLIDERPTGSVRVSFGYMSNYSDADVLINMITQCFVVHPLIMKNPDNWSEYSRSLKNKFNFVSSKDKPLLDLILIAKDQQEELTSKLKQILPVKANLKSIFIYPVKSCGAFSVHDSWQLSETGLKYDRQWMIVSEDGVVLTQKQLPQMCLIIPRIDINIGTLYLKFSSSEVAVPLEIRKEDMSTVLVCNSKVCSDRVRVIDSGNEIAEWLQKKLDRPGIRLVKLFSRNKKNCNFVEDLSLANQAQYLLITESSVRWLLDRCSSLENESFNNMLQRFRSNLVITCDCLPFEEFDWSEIQIGSTTFQVEGLCQRCQMICIDQTTGEKNREPLTVLSTEFKGKMKFGLYLRLENSTSSTLRINDVVRPMIKK